MATTDSGFQFKRNLAGHTTGMQMSYTIENSATLTVGDAVRASYDTTTADGAVEPVTAGATILGFIVAITDRQGVDLENSRLTLSTGAWTESTKTFVAGSDNETVDKVKAVVDIDPFSVWSAQPDAAIGTTTSSGSSDQLGSYTDLVDKDQPDENNGGSAFNTKAQLFIHGRDPENTARGLYSIAEHQLWGA